MASKVLGIRLSYHKGLEKDKAESSSIVLFDRFEGNKTHPTCLGSQKELL